MSRHDFANKMDERHNRNDKVWREGYNAGLAGQLFKSNPYKDDLSNYDFVTWTHGWAFGRHTKTLKDEEEL